MCRMLRWLIFPLTLVLAACGADKPAAMTDDGWSQYRKAFLTSEGAIVDTGNGGISHSEGQGYGMLLALAYGDRKSFDRMWQWTQAHLQIRDDALLAWRWHPEDGVTDKNNATDGDILVAWALLRASLFWDETKYRDAAAKLLQGIRENLVVAWQGQPVLLPGAYGFRFEEPLEGHETGDDSNADAAVPTRQRITINLAYWVYPALQDFARYDRNPIWVDLIRSGKQLTRASTEANRLPPDWLDLYPDRGPVAARDREHRFGFEAVRLPLYLIWSGDYRQAAVVSTVDFWRSAESGDGRIPAWIDLDSGATSEYGAPPGFHAIRHLAEAAVGGETAAMVASKRISEQDYYSASLTLLSRLAFNERFNP